MGDLRVGSSDADNNESDFYRRHLLLKIFDNRSNCRLADVYLLPIINNPGLTIKIPAHELILQNCPFFAKILEETRGGSSQGQRPVYLHLKSDPISIELILKYIYTGEVDLNGENLMKLLQASKFFELPNLTQKCFKFILEEESYLNVNGVELFRFTMTDGGRRYQLKIFEFLRSNIGQLLQSDDLPTLDFNEIKILLKPSNRVFPTQEDYTKVVLKWIADCKADCKQQYIDELAKLKWDDTIVVDLATETDNESLELENQNVHVQIQQNNQNDEIGYNQMAKRPRLSVHHRIIFLVENEWPAPDSLYTFSFEDKKISKLTEMPYDSVCFGVISIKRRLFLLGGYFQSDVSQEMHSLSLNQNDKLGSMSPQLWKKEINLLLKLSHFSTILLRGSIYVVGGKNVAERSIGSIHLLTLDENEHAQEWTLIFNMKIARYLAGVAVLNNILYISGGKGRKINLLDLTNPDFELDSFEMIDLDKKVGEILPNMNQERYGHRLVAFQDKLYAIGGMQMQIDPGSENRDFVKSRNVEIYDPVSKIWTPGEPMHDTRCRFAVFATSSNIVVLGGNGVEDDAPTIENFDPVTNSWSRIEAPEFPDGTDFYNSHVHIY